MTPADIQWIGHDLTSIDSATTPVRPSPGCSGVAGDTSQTAAKHGAVVSVSSEQGTAPPPGCLPCSPNPPGDAS